MPTEDTPPYRDLSLSAEERARDLLARMTIDEKLAQLGALWSFEVFDGQGLDVEQARERLAQGIGQVTRVAGATNLPPGQVADFGNQIQRFLVEETRLGIPAILHEESLHGVMARRRDLLPAVHRPGRQLGCRARREGGPAHRGAPASDGSKPGAGAGPGHHPRPALGSTRGDLRGGSLPGGDAGLCLRARHPGHGRRRPAGHRHRQAHGRPRRPGGRPQHGPGAHRPTRVARRLPLPLRSRRARGRHRLGHARLRRARRPALRRIPRAAHDHPSRALGVRRHRRGRLPGHRAPGHPARDRRRPLRRRGHDPGRRPGHGAAGHERLRATAPRRRWTMAAWTWRWSIVAVERVLRTKLRLGLFERPYARGSDPGRDLPCARGGGRALVAARRSIVLLENDGVLPLPVGLARLAVIGPNAHDARNLVGDYGHIVHIETLLENRGREGVAGSAAPLDLQLADELASWSTVLEAIRGRVGPGTEVRYAAGCGVMGGGDDDIAAAVEAARGADVAILVLGERSGLTTQCTCGETRDRCELGLPGRQAELVAAVAATGTPVVIVLVSGRPLAIPREAALRGRRPARLGARRSGPGSHRRGALRRCEPRREVARDRAASRRTGAPVLRAQALRGPIDVAPGLRGRLAPAALALRPRPSPTRASSSAGCGSAARPSRWTARWS